MVVMRRVRGKKPDLAIVVAEPLKAKRKISAAKQKEYDRNRKNKRRSRQDLSTLDSHMHLK